MCIRDSCFHDGHAPVCLCNRRRSLVCFSRRWHGLQTVAYQDTHKNVARLYTLVWFDCALLTRSSSQQWANTVSPRDYESKCYILHMHTPTIHDWHIPGCLHLQRCFSSSFTPSSFYRVVGIGYRPLPTRKRLPAKARIFASIRFIVRCLSACCLYNRESVSTNYHSSTRFMLYACICLRQRRRAGDV